MIRMRDSYKAYLDEITSGMSVRAIARTAGISESKLNRQLNGATLDADVVVAICRAFEAPFLPAFVAAEFITQDEANKAVKAKGLEFVTDDQLAKEAVRRMGQGRGKRGVEDLPDNVTPLHQRTSDMAARDTGERIPDDDE